MGTPLSPYSPGKLGSLVLLPMGFILNFLCVVCGQHQGAGVEIHQIWHASEELQRLRPFVTVFIWVIIRAMNQNPHHQCAGSVNR